MRENMLGLVFHGAIAMILSLGFAPARAAVLSTGAADGSAGGDLCADVAYDSIRAGAPINLVPCNAGPAEQYELNYTTIYTIGGQRCMGVLGSGAPGSGVDSAKCNGSGSQQWYYKLGQVINVPSGLCLDASAGSDHQLSVNSCNGATTQEWQIK